MGRRPFLFYLQVLLGCLFPPNGGANGTIDGSGRAPDVKYKPETAGSDVRDLITGSLA